MAFDGLVLYSITAELQEKLITARVDKIYQPEQDLLTILLRNRGQNFSLLLSSEPQYARIHLTKEKFTNPPHPSAFCMLLRKYLSGGRIIELIQPGLERILYLIIQNLNERGQVVRYQLVVELMGRHSNLILLTEDQTILDGIKRIPSGISRYREILPGRAYITPPAQDKANPLLAEKKSFLALLQLEPELKLFQAILKNYQGISPLIAREIVARAALDPQMKIKEASTLLPKLWESFSELFLALQNKDLAPTLVFGQKEMIKEYSCFHLEQFKSLPQKTFPSISELLDDYYVRKIKKQVLIQISSGLMKTINTRLEKSLKKEEKLNRQLANAENAVDYRIMGEMLTANLFQIKKGATELRTTNYYHPEMIEIIIPLDPALSPQSNAAKYFKRYHKLKTSIKYLEQELAKLKPEIEYLKNVKLSLERIESREDFEEIRDELISEGYIRDKRRVTPNRQQIISKPIQFKSSDNFDILVGRNNRQNDRLTKGIASREDLWFHAQEIPGSHVVIRNHDRRKIPDQTLKEAATLAAYYSKARESTTVPVDFTLIKYVNKAKGAKPGLVFYDNYQTIIVNPDKNLVKRLQKT